jgi:hypothetical protein
MSTWGTRITPVAAGVVALLAAAAYPLRSNLAFLQLALILGAALIVVAIFLPRLDPSSATARAGYTLHRLVVAGLGVVVLLGAGTLLVGPLRAAPALLGIALILVAVFLPRLELPFRTTRAGRALRRIVVAAVGVGALAIAFKPPVGKPPWIAATGVALFLLALAFLPRPSPTPKT